MRFNKSNNQFAAGINSIQFNSIGLQQQQQQRLLFSSRRNYTKHAWRNLKTTSQIKTQTRVHVMQPKAAHLM